MESEEMTQRESEESVMLAMGAARWRAARWSSLTISTAPHSSARGMVVPRSAVRRHLAMRSLEVEPPPCSRQTTYTQAQ